MSGNGKGPITLRGVSDERVLAAMRKVPRHVFVPAEYSAQSYDDHPLPIGYGQTISQPYVVGLMTELLEIKPGDRVLEVGTGSGYQTAILAELAKQVYSVEIIPQLAAEAKERLLRLGYRNIQLANHDGYFGWEEHTPYDAIVVTAACEHIPEPLTQQLKDGGRLVIPVGPIGGTQILSQIIKQGDKLINNHHGPVRFVPLTRGPEAPT